MTDQRKSNDYLDRGLRTFYATVPHERIASSAARARKDHSPHANLVRRPVRLEIGRVVYGACYCLSYVVCFPTFLIVSFIPENSAFARGMTDGARSAQQSVAERHIRRAARRRAIA